MSVSERLPLSGGVSCEVWIERDANGNQIVVKEPLAKLKVVADWRSNPDRYRVEARALDVVRELLGEGTSPKVLSIDDANRRFSMQLIEPRFRNWKRELLAGRVNLQTAERVGELLALLHSRSSARTDLAREFAKRVYFEELRIEPFFTRVAARNPNIADAIAIAVESLRDESRAFVHGDFSPKNLLVDGREVVILDLEIAHWGNPRFDLGFMLSHLVLKGLRRDAAGVEFAAAAETFIEAYAKHNFAPILDAMLVRITGCLMLARFDGASPVDYAHDLDAKQVRKIASDWIVNPQDDVSEAVNYALRASLANEK